MNHADALLERISNATAVVGVIGLGYVGLPLADAVHSSGFRVLGFDIDPKKPEMLRRAEPYLRHLGEELPRRLASSERFEATTDFTRLGECDALIVCVPTPLNNNHEPDLSYVLGTARDIGRTLRAGQLLVLESTSYPGTTRDDFAPEVLRSWARTVAQGPAVTPSHPPRAIELGRDVFVAFSPEREDPGNPRHSTRTIPKLVGGLDDASRDLAVALYSKAVESVVPVASAEVAEAAKLLENIFRAVNIALVNEMKLVLGAMGIDVWDVVRAASTKPFGYMPFYPGPGLGGHCIPIDPFYMAWKARQVGRPTRLIELAGEVNVSMPRHVIGRLSEALDERGVPLAGARVLVLGLAYKPDIDDVRESPSFELIRLLRDAGANPDYSDPHVPATWPGRKGDLGMTSVTLDARSIASYDAILMSTNHRAFDYPTLARHARLIIDTRDAFRDFAPIMGERLVKA